MVRNSLPALAALAVIGFISKAEAQTALSPSPVTAHPQSNTAQPNMAQPTPDSGQQLFADRMAAAFYEEELRLSQSRRIEADTAEIYRSLLAQERLAFRERRRLQWRSFTEDQRRELKDVKRPAYANLTETQKAPFRQSAIRKLGVAPSSSAAAISLSAQDI